MTCIYDDTAILPVQSADHKAWWRRAYDWIFEGYKMEQQRRGLEPLHEMTDDQLRDLGITRGDVNWALSQPASAQAGLELEAVRRKNWYV